MLTLNELIMIIEDIQKKINSIEFKGSENARLLVEANNECQQLIDAIKDFIKSQTVKQEEGEANG